MNQSRRRQLLLAVHALAVALIGARPSTVQPATARPFQIGFTMGLVPATREALLKLMAERGWIYGKDFTFLDLGGVPFGSDVEGSARRIVQEKPDLIVVGSTASALAVHRLDPITPIVMYVGGDPVLAGVANSLSRPGRNVTGNVLFADAGLYGKLFELMREAKPTVRRIGVLWGYLPPTFLKAEVDKFVTQLQIDARALGVDTDLYEIKHVDDVQRAMAAVKQSRPDALLITGGPFISPRLPQVLKDSFELRLPTILDSHYPNPLDPGPLLVYAPPLFAIRHQTVGYIDRIMRGAKPGDLPIQQPASFDLVINLKTAKSLGLTIPKALLLRADRVIE